MDSVLEQLASETSGKASVGIIRESERELFKTFGVRQIPATFIIYKAEVKKSYSGFKDKESLADALKEYENR